jgi:proteasome beta subunit
VIEDLRPSGLPLDRITPDSSFSSLLKAHGIAPRWDVPPGSAPVEAAEATTVLALRYSDGVLMVGDRQATAGNVVAHRRVQKVYPADAFSAVAISGTAGIAMELIRLFQTELEHYEKLEGTRLSLEGKANYLGAMLRGQLPMALQGLVVVPLFCGYDEFEETGRLYSYDVVGGRYEERDHAATGSGGFEAQSYLRASFAPDLGEDDAVTLGIGALVAAAEEDTATGGPDLRRDILPSVVTVSAGGYRDIPEDRVRTMSQAALESAP